MQHVKDLDLFAVSPVLSLYRSRNAKLSGKGLSPDSLALRDGSFSSNFGQNAQFRTTS